MENEYRPKCGDALRLGSKGRYGSFHLWINVWVAGNSVWSLVNTCHTWALWRWVSHNKALYLATVRLLMVTLGLHHESRMLADVFSVHLCGHYIQRKKENGWAKTCSFGVSLKENSKYYWLVMKWPVEHINIIPCLCWHRWTNNCICNWIKRKDLKTVT